MRGILESQALNAWIPADHILAAGLGLPARYDEGDARVRFQEKLLSALAILPGVTGAALVSNPPGTGANKRHVEIEGAAAGK